MNAPFYLVGKYKCPGIEYYVLRNGHICFSGSKVICENFVKHKQRENNETQSII